MLPNKNAIKMSNNSFEVDELCHKIIEIHGRTFDMILILGNNNYKIENELL